MRAMTGTHIDSGSSLDEENSLLSELPLILLQWLCLNEGLWSILGDPRAEPDRFDLEVRILEDVVGPSMSGLCRMPKTCLPPLLA